MLRRLDLPPTLERAVREFHDVRNAIVHGQGATEHTVRRAIDSGVKILRALEATPRQEHWVVTPHVDVYEDEKGRRRRPDVHGVMIETIGADGTASVNVYPTTRTHFRASQRVTWEWNTNHTWPRSWHRDPETGEVRHAWDAAAEFVGRHFEVVDV
jgi:hypothetical protein